MGKISMSNKVALKKNLLWSLYSRQIIDIKRHMSNDAEKIDHNCHRLYFINKINEKSDKIKKVEETHNEIIKYYLKCVYNNNGYLFINKTKLEIDVANGYNVYALDREFYKMYRDKRLKKFFYTTDCFRKHQIDSINKYVMGTSGFFSCQNNEIAMTFRVKLKIPDNENYSDYCNMVLDTFKSVFDERMKRKNNPDYFTKVIEHSYRKFCKSLKDSTSLNLLAEIIEDDLIRKVSVKVYQECEKLINSDSYAKISETTTAINDIIYKLVEKNEIEKRLGVGNEGEKLKLKKRRM